MKARLVVAIALGAALVALPATALGSSAHVASNSQSFTDSTGEDAQAPDITSVQVSNDDTGAVTFKVNISNRPALTSDMAILVYVDADQKATTGDANLLGADYVIQLVPGAVALFQWNGSDFTFAQSQTSLTYSYDATGATLHISAADLGGTHGFNFGVEADSGITTDAQGNPDFTNAHFDLAPDPGHGFYNYKVLAKVKLTQTAYTVSAAKAGKVFQVSLAANESDTAGPVTAGTVACSAKVGTVALRGTHSLANGVATCVFKLPKTAKGKTVRGKITLTVQGTALTKTFIAKVH
jgi:hypothetical protein